MDKYNKDYYETGVQLGISGYSNYRWMPNLTIPMAERLIEYLAIDKNDKILDFGCAKGFLVKAFTDLGYDCQGADISPYALDNAPEEIKDKLFKYEEDTSVFDYYNLVIAKDVFEHIEPDELSRVLNIMQEVSDRLFCIVPLGNGDSYVIPEYENDITHVIRQPREWWIEFFQSNGYNIQYFSYLMDGLKDNWSHYKKGNGFFVLS